MARKLLIANWKLNGNLAANEAFFGAISAVDGVEAVVCVPFPYLAQASSRLSERGMTLGAQTVSEFQYGAYTGEVSAEMLMEMGCRYVIIGHSERRSLFSEDDAMVGRKVAAALQVGLKPVVCVGESLSEREAGKALEVAGQQLDAVLAVVGVPALAKLTLAYEPVWAIGSGRVADVDEVESMHAGLRSWLDGWGAEAVRILYGGSLKPDNAAALLAADGVDGGLIGGASLAARDFMAICRAAASGA
jgi:triosephosphate isomerase